MGVWDYSKAAAVITTSPTPILDALGCQYGVPTCVLNFTKAALTSLMILRTVLISSHHS